MYPNVCDYDDELVPLLRRLVNLEELKLYLSVIRCDSNYIDGIQLHNDFLVYMTQLKKFAFYIETYVQHRYAHVELQSIEFIQRSFVGRDYQGVASYVDDKSSGWTGICRIYSLPYDFEYYYHLNHYFRGGMFHKVRQLEVCDDFYFKLEFFQLISESFPFLVSLTLSRHCLLKHKRHSSLTILTFPYLTFLNLRYSDYDYVKLFLLKKNAHLPRLSHLCTNYTSLTRITNNFTIDATYFNFCKIRSLDLPSSFVRPKKFQKYFPFL